MILSIIIPMYKVESYIERCLESCINQDIACDQYEIICVNDGSPDNSSQIAKKMAEKHKNIRVIDKPNGGLSSARNTGFDNSNGDYVFYVDSDDWIHNNCLGRICKRLENEKPDVLAICAANVFGDEIVRRMSYNETLVLEGRKALRINPSSCAPFSIVSRKFITGNEIRFYEGIYHEDVEYTARMLYLAKKVIYMNDLVYMVYQNPNSITRTVNIKKIKDVISVVGPSLHQFSKQYVADKDQDLYHDRIAVNLSMVLTRNCNMTIEQEEEVNALMKKNKYLIKHLFSSSYLRYKVLAVPLFLFPGYTVQIIKTILKFIK